MYRRSRNRKPFNTRVTLPSAGVAVFFEGEVEYAGGVILIECAPHVVDGPALVGGYAYCIDLDANTSEGPLDLIVGDGGRLGLVGATGLPAHNLIVIPQFGDVVIFPNCQPPGPAVFFINASEEYIRWGSALLQVV